MSSLKRQRPQEDNSSVKHDTSDSEHSECSSDDEEIVNVDFDFYSPDSDIDFHGIKRFLQNTFGDDSEEFNLSELADLILEQPYVGSTIKCEGEKGDPYAIMTVLNLHEHREKSAIQQIKKYLLKKSERTPASSGFMTDILAGHAPKGKVGLLLSERVVNMPPQVIPPMLKMLLEELQQATEEQEPFDLEYFILLSPMYRETEAIHDDDDDGGDDDEGEGSKKNQKKPKQQSLTDAFMRAEEEIMAEFASHSFNYKFSRNNRTADSRNSFSDFGLEPSRRCLIIPKSQMSAMLHSIEQKLPQAPSV